MILRCRVNKIYFSNRRRINREEFSVDPPGYYSDAATKSQIKQFEAKNQEEQLRTAKSRLKRYLELLEKVRAL